MMAVWEIHPSIQGLHVNTSLQPLERLLGGCRFQINSQWYCVAKCTCRLLTSRRDWILLMQRPQSPSSTVLYCIVLYCIVLYALSNLQSSCWGVSLMNLFILFSWFVSYGLTHRHRGRESATFLRCWHVCVTAVVWCRCGHAYIWGSDPHYWCCCWGGFQAMGAHSTALVSFILNGNAWNNLLWPYGQLE